MKEKIKSELWNISEEDPVREKLARICSEFRIAGDVILYRLIPSGHINTAYYVAVYDGYEVRQYLVQKVNWYVFKDPVAVMRNIDLITEHIRRKEKVMERRRRLHFHHTKDGNNYLILEEDGQKEFWRLYNFIEGSVSFESSGGNPEVLRMAGKAIGHFESQLGDFDASLLVESIPHFHDTRDRLEKFFQAAERDTFGRAGEIQEEIAFIRENQSFGCTLCDMVERGELPLRVTHNDTKTNNILFDRDTLDPLVVVDLDTCMPGLACHDFGDTIRFAATTGWEDLKDLSKMRVNLELFRAFAEGYIGEMADVLTENEIGSMALGAAIITLELSSRFLCDYLEGDKYFRIKSPDHNLVRGRAQLALYKDLVKHLDDMDRIVHEVAEAEKKKRV